MTLKSLKPMFAEKLDYDFAHMKLQILAKNANRTLLPLEEPVQNINYFKANENTFVV
jgi:hypothetical protein